jgi:hypothetical protein
MNYRIATNNPSVKEVYKDIIFVNGTFLDVLINVRDLVHKGHELISHPLGSSIRTMYSPYRSIIVRNKTNEINKDHIEVIENSIYSYKNTMQRRKPDAVNSKDYAMLDLNLLKSALDEFKSIYDY